jgi:antigen 43
MANRSVNSGWTLSSGVSGYELVSGATSSSISVAAGDTITVNSGGTTVGINVSSGVTMAVNSGGKTSGTTISGGGTMSAFKGSTEIGTTVLSGGILDEVNSGTDITDPISVRNGGEIEFGFVTAAGATVTSNFVGGNEIITVTGTGNQPRSMSITVKGTPTFSAATVGGKAGVQFASDSPPVCYVEGTKILAEHGEVTIESLRANDKVVVRRDGVDVLEPVTWIGRTSIDLSRHARPEQAAPIRIKAGALAENVPVRDLVVSPEHCMIVTGRCVPAKLLLNSGSITREFPTTPFHYYHVELARHGILIAEGAEAESYLDTGNRSTFDNADEPRMLHPMFEVNADAERWKTEACAPLAVTADELAAAWQIVADRSAALGFVVEQPATVADPDLHIVVDGRQVQPVTDHNGRYVFAVAAGARSVALVSRSFIPSDRMDPMLRDPRRLGVRVDWIAIRSDGNDTILPADHPTLRQGWYPLEKTATEMWRWTDGAATIPWENVDGPAVLTIRALSSGWYPVSAPAASLAA